MGLISETADARRLRLDALSRPDSLLLTDLYQLNMMQAYFDRGMMEPAVFELFIRKLPDRRGFFLAAGLEQAADFLEAMRLTEEERAWAESSGRFSRAFLDWLSELRFDGDLHAIPEGTVVFPDEPFLRVTAAAAGGPAGGKPAACDAAGPDRGGVEGGADRPGGRGPHGRRFRPSSGQRDRGRAAGGARGLCRRLRGNRHRAGGTGLRHPDLRDHWRIPSSRPTTTRWTRSVTTPGPGLTRRRS